MTAAKYVEGTGATSIEVDYQWFVSGNDNAHHGEGVGRLIADATGETVSLWFESLGVPFDGIVYTEDFTTGIPVSYTSALNGLSGTEYAIDAESALVGTPRATDVRMRQLLQAAAAHTPTLRSGDAAFSLDDDGQVSFWLNYDNPNGVEQPFTITFHNETDATDHTLALYGRACTVNPPQAAGWNQYVIDLPQGVYHFTLSDAGVSASAPTWHGASLIELAGLIAYTPESSTFFPVPVDRNTVSCQVQWGSPTQLWVQAYVDWGVPQKGQAGSTLITGTQVVGPPSAFGNGASWFQMDFTMDVPDGATVWHPRFQFYDLDPSLFLTETVEASMTLVGVNEVDNDGSPDLPAGTAAGDLLVVAVTGGPSSDSPTINDSRIAYTFPNASTDDDAHQIVGYGFEDGTGDTLAIDITDPDVDGKIVIAAYRVTGTQSEVDVQGKMIDADTAVPIDPVIDGEFGIMALAMTVASGHDTDDNWSEDAVGDGDTNSAQIWSAEGPDFAFDSGAAPDYWVGVYLSIKDATISIDPNTPVPGLTSTYDSRPMAYQFDPDTLATVGFVAPHDFAHGDQNVATSDVSGQSADDNWVEILFLDRDQAHTVVEDDDGIDMGTQYVPTTGTIVSQTLHVIYSSAGTLLLSAQEGDGASIQISEAAAGDHLTASQTVSGRVYDSFCALFINGVDANDNPEAIIYEWWIETIVSSGETVAPDRPVAGTQIMFDCIYVPENGKSVAQQPYLDGDQSYGIWEGTPRDATSLMIDPNAPPPNAFDPTVALPDSLIV